VADAKIENEVKTGTENSFRRHFGEKRFLWGFLVFDRACFGDYGQYQVHVRMLS